MRVPNTHAALFPDGTLAMLSKPVRSFPYAARLLVGRAAISRAVSLYGASCLE
jgi:hypothetical protein